MIQKWIRSTGTLLSTAVAFASCSLLAQTPSIEKTMQQELITVEKPSMMIVGIECRTSNAPDAALQDIPKLWEKFFRENICDRIPHKIADEIIALYCDYDSDYREAYSLVIGYQVDSLDSIPEGMVGKVLPATHYALFHAIGEHPQAIIETWGKIWESDLKRTYTGDYEVYGEKFVTGSPKQVDVFIAIAKE